MVILSDVQTVSGWRRGVVKRSVAEQSKSLTIVSDSSELTELMHPLANSDHSLTTCFGWTTRCHEEISVRRGGALGADAT